MYSFPIVPENSISLSFFSIRNVETEFYFGRIFVYYFCVMCSQSSKWQLNAIFVVLLEFVFLKFLEVFLLYSLNAFFTLERAINRADSTTYFVEL